MRAGSVSTFLGLAGALLVGSPVGAEQIVTPRLHHLRAGAEPEWADFPRQAEGPSLRLHFRSGVNAGEWTLRLRQQDVKQTWKVLLNGKELGRLPPDENDQVLALPVPPRTLVDGDNTLAVEQVGKVADDIRVGEISLDDRPLRQVLSEATVDVTVLDAGQAGKATPLPCRLTILDARGSLAAVGAASADHLAVRTGVVYTGTGQARFGLPAGDYTVYAGRGFAYGIDSVRLSLRPGDVVRKTLAIRREVPTPGYASCDTHVHTLTHSGHGDATLKERVVTLAGEGIELLVATEHNLQVDYETAAIQQGVRQYFTPVVGNEVTTAVGHFNVFPMPAGGPVPDFNLKDWKSVFASIDRTPGAKVVVLNHPRDLHAGFRPFGPGRHLALTGEDLDGWVLRANAVEVVNSGAQQTDVLQPVRDWLGLLNRGLSVAPVGSSDSHDVSRYIVGQGRTYVRCRAARPGEIDVAEAVDNFRRGRVLVSCGLLADITVNDRYGPGDQVPAVGEVKVAVRVLGPGWVRADRVALYANGVPVREARITGEQKPGVKWEGVWTLPKPRYDAHLVAVATGPAVTDLYWPIAKPYQPTSPVVERRVLGVTGAVWLDGDGDGKRTSAYEYARRLCDALGARTADVVQSLAAYDEAVAAQAAGLLQGRGVSASDPAIRETARKAGPQVERGFQAFAEAWRESQVARSEHR
jgi:hypothetical protein